MFPILFFLFCCVCVHGWSLPYDVAEEFHNDLLQNYSKRLRPAKDQAEAMEVTVRWQLESINTFHEVSGEFISTSTFTIIWTDEMLKWGISRSKYLYVLLDSTELWNPALMVSNPSGNENIGKRFTTGKVRGTSDGKQFVTVTVMTSTTCQPDMNLYPFDRHDCTIKLASSDYISNEVFITPVDDSEISDLEDISQWNVLEFYTNNGTEVLSSVATFGVIFQRKPEFIIVNLLTPIILLCFLNLSVFLLPPQSGERVSFSVTMFLSFSVYMTLISEKLPITNPVSIFTKYLMCNVGYSALILFTTVIGLRFHMAKIDEQMPVWLSKMFCTCRSTCMKDKQSATTKEYEINITTTNTEYGDLHTDSGAIKDTNIPTMQDDGHSLTKMEFGVMLDKFFFAIFFAMLVIANIVYGVYIISL
ncbi:acetylcholine receptor subunit alpha-like [Argopecten irradians]|uniref:acetylcholine receptor subunit alpha-like n=1 Tax=Argopecten irradians TaxID=31199 RepID=UPI00371B9D70